MKVLAADRFPGAESDPLSYPGTRPRFSFVYHRGLVYEMRAAGPSMDGLMLDRSTSVDKFLASCGQAPLAQRYAVLAVGSNGCPGRLAEKYGAGTDAAVPVLVGRIANTLPVYVRRPARYGALPATYLRRPGAVCRLSLTLLDDRQLELMDETERVGTIYRRIPVPESLQVDRGPVIDGISAYLDPQILAPHGTPILVKSFSPEGVGWPALEQRELLALVFDEAGLLMGLSPETRHQRLLKDDQIRTEFQNWLNTHGSGLEVDETGSLVSC